MRLAAADGAHGRLPLRHLRALATGHPEVGTPVGREAVAVELLRVLEGEAGHGAGRVLAGGVGAALATGRSRGRNGGRHGRGGGGTGRGGGGRADGARSVGAPVGVAVAELDGLGARRAAPRGGPGRPAVRDGRLMITGAPGPCALSLKVAGPRLVIAVVARVGWSRRRCRRPGRRARRVRRRRAGCASRPLWTVLGARYIGILLSLMSHARNYDREPPP